MKNILDKIVKLLTKSVSVLNTQLKLNLQSTQWLIEKLNINKYETIIYNKGLVKVYHNGDDFYILYHRGSNTLYIDRSLIWVAFRDKFNQPDSENFKKLVKEILTPVLQKNIKNIVIKNKIKYYNQFFKQKENKNEEALLYSKVFQKNW